MERNKRKEERNKIREERIQIKEDEKNKIREERNKIREDKKNKRKEERIILKKSIIPQHNIIDLSSNININSNSNLLLIHNNNKLNEDIIINNINNIYNNISFITLTNNGYIDYTLNCLQSLKNINMEKQLKVYCIGQEGYSILQNNNFLCELINNNENNTSTFQEFRQKNWSNVVYYKFEIIYNNLLNNEYVCITDGDIVYENNIVFDYLLSNINDNDMLIQTEGIESNNVCSGFMFIKSNEKTISLFNPENVEKYKNKVGWGDQVYVNEIKSKLKFKKLPLELFPNGKYYYEYSNNIQPYLIHFNWIVGHEKKKKMIKYNKWYISKKN